jgi:hypothetical protein
MPFEPSEFIPGRGRGMIGWHLYPVGRRLEAVTLLADDAAGLNEAVGTLTEIIAGMEPLLPTAPPASSRIAAATAPRPRPAEPVIAWRAVLPDRAVSIKCEGGLIVVHTLDGTLSTLDAQGKIVSQKPGTVPAIAKSGLAVVPAGIKDKLPGNRLPKLAAAEKALVAVGYWGGTLQVFGEDGSVKFQQQLPQDFAAMGWQGEKLIVGLADGRVLALAVR